MANKNQTRINKALSKSRKTGKAVDTSFGAEDNNNRSRKNYKKGNQSPKES